MEKFTITKKIAKHGKHTILHIPRDLQKYLIPQTLVEVNIKILERPNQNELD